MPEYVNIFGVLYEVEYFGDPTGEDNWGECIHEKRKIRVYAGPGASEFDTLVTKVHEMCHAILGEGLIALRGVLGDNEEAFVNDFTAAFVDTMVRNKIIKLKGGK